jgi:hypothetical protein
MYRYLVLFLRHYSLKQTIVRAEDVEKATAGISGEPEQGTGEEHPEERVSEPTNDNGDDDIKTTTVVDTDEKASFEGHDITEMQR